MSMHGVYNMLSDVSSRLVRTVMRHAYGVTVNEGSSIDVVAMETC